MSKQFHAFRAPPVSVPPPSAHVRKAWLRLSRDVGLRVRSPSSRLRFALLSFTLLLFLTAVAAAAARLALLARASRRVHGGLALRATACACPLAATPALFSRQVLARAAFVARVAFLRDEGGAVALRVEALFRGGLRAAAYEVVVRKAEAGACFDGGLGAKRMRGKSWLVVAGGWRRDGEGVASGQDRSVLLPTVLAGPGCADGGGDGKGGGEGAMVWMAPWGLLSGEVVESIREDAAEGELWWRRRHAWHEFAPAMRRAANASGRVLRVGKGDWGGEGEDWWVGEGVSLVAACKDRSSTLATAVSSWVRVKGLGEILVVDWSSDPPIDGGGLGIRDARVTVVRVDGQADWVLSRAYNLAVRMARFAAVLKVDCDTHLDASFLKAHVLPKGTFYAGDWHRLESRVTNELHVNGLLYVRRDDYLAIGGYDERITTYGWDDSDIAERLSRTLKAEAIDYSKVRHIAHPASWRVANQRHESLLSAENPHAAAVEIQKNRLLLTRFHLPAWRATSPHTLWNVEPAEGRVGLGGRREARGRMFRVVAANEVTSASELVSDADAMDAAKRAVRLILHRYGVQLLPKTLTLDFYKALITKVAFPEQYAEVVLSLRGGCASRLLAYASSVQATTSAAAADGVAEDGDGAYVRPPLPYKGWRMQGLWRYPDGECSCKFSNVFDAADEEVISLWVDQANPVRPFIPISRQQPSENVSAILRSFESKAKVKVVSEELQKWATAVNSLDKQSKPRMLADDLACDLDPRHVSARRRGLIRMQLRKLAATKDIQEGVVTSLMDQNPTILDSPLLKSPMWPALVGSEYAANVTRAFSEAQVHEMVISWGATPMNTVQLTHRLDTRAVSLTIAVHVSEHRRIQQDKLTPMQYQTLTETVDTLSKRVERLFMGCSMPPSIYLDAYPELAVILAAFISCGTCV